MKQKIIQFSSMVIGRNGNPFGLMKDYVLTGVFKNLTTEFYKESTKYIKYNNVINAILQEQNVIDEEFTDKNGYPINHHIAFREAKSTEIQIEKNEYGIKNPKVLGGYEQYKNFLKILKFEDIEKQNNILEFEDMNVSGEGLWVKPDNVDKAELMTKFFISHIDLDKVPEKFQPLITQMADSIRKNISQNPEDYLSSEDWEKIYHADRGEKLSNKEIEQLSMVIAKIFKRTWKIDPAIKEELDYLASKGEKWAGYLSDFYGYEENESIYKINHTTVAVKDAEEAYELLRKNQTYIEYAIDEKVSFIKVQGAKGDLQQFSICALNSQRYLGFKEFLSVPNKKDENGNVIFYSNTNRQKKVREGFLLKNAKEIFKSTDSYIEKISNEEEKKERGI
jgi:hypothetical protein